ncbi:hypothetical protein F0562_030779 [Nyssa sinensis]|uniref:Uncharacterized protein n=1 Tax=Nyssa sinensis TaxID=561372 RepID=A0A5J5B1X1_9ASTE|nr:hypothetical protein F0562_030779 [Nyssa sinensis]
MHKNKRRGPRHILYAVAKPVVAFPKTVSGSVPKFGDREPKSLNMYLPLYRAALKAGARHTKFVEELVNKISANDLELKNKDGNTALCFAAASGITWIAEVMVNKNINLPRIRGSQGVTPLYMAALLGHRDMVWYLYSVTGDEYLKLEDFFGLLVAAISSDLYDFALYVLGRHPHLAIRYDRNRETALHVLARKPSAFASGSRLGIWERGIYPWIHVELPNKSKCGSNSSRSQASVNNYDGPPLTGLLWLAIKLRVPGIKAVYEKKLSHMQALELVKCLCEEVMSQVESQSGDSFIISSKTLFIATEFGIVEFVAELISTYPEFIWMVDDENRSLFHIAVMHRRAKIFSLIYSIGAHKDLITSYKDRGDNNMLHLAGKLAPSYLLNVVSGPALQMQRELLWFKEVEKIVQPAYKEIRDSNNRTPQMLFSDEHKGLAKEGEDWMKHTASSCMLVATLITTKKISTSPYHRGYLLLRPRIIETCLSL